MEEIKEGEYVRTEDIKSNYRSFIGKVIKVTEDYFQLDCEDSYIIHSFTEKVKHSKNLIDILEVGDFVNYHLIVNKKNDEGKTELGLESDIILNKYIEDNEIINVLTKEQYNQNSYKRNINLKERE